jgi:hypothetical protein
MTHEHHRNFTLKPNLKLTDFLEVEPEGSTSLIPKLAIGHSFETFPSIQPLSLTATLILTYNSSWIKRSHVRNNSSLSSALQIRALACSNPELTSECTNPFQKRKSEKTKQHKIKQGNITPYILDERHIMDHIHLFIHGSTGVVISLLPQQNTN